MNQQVLQERKVEQMVGALRILLVVGIIAVVIGAAAMWMQGRSSAKNEKAFAMLFQAEQMEQAAAREGESQKLDPFKIMNAWVPEKKKEYEGKLQNVIKEYPDSAAAAISSLRLARFYFSAQQYKEARETYKSLIDHSSGSNLAIYKAMAWDGLASTLENENNFEEARKAYESGLSLKGNPLKPIAYLGQARTFKALGKKDEAKGAYEKLMQEFPGTPYAQRARVLLYSGL